MSIVNSIIKVVGGTQISLPSDREIAVTRVFNAPKALVFEAMTVPALIRRWLGFPTGWVMTECEFDARVGGTYRYAWRSDAGFEMGMGGTCLEITPPTRIVVTERFDEAWYPGDGYNTTELVEQDGRTTMTLTLRYESKETRDAVLGTPAVEGMNVSYERLEELVRSMAADVPASAPAARSASPRITPFLWFDGTVEAAMTFYTDVFPNSTIVNVSRAPGANGEPGPVFSATFELEGQRFHALNGGPMYRFTPAISFFVNCETQEEVDRLWGRLTEGGSEQQCGWLTDRFGLSWQIIPSALGRMLGDRDREKSGRAMQAMMQMKKIDIAGLERAFDGR